MIVRKCDVCVTPRSAGTIKNQSALGPEDLGTQEKEIKDLWYISDLLGTPQLPDCQAGGRGGAQPITEQEMIEDGHGSALRSLDHFLGTPLVYLCIRRWTEEVTFTKFVIFDTKRE